MLVVHNGIDSHQFRPDPSVRDRMRRELQVEGKFVWVAAGRLEKAKDYPTLLRAFAKLWQDGSTLLICGRGSLAGELEALLAELGLGERVRFLGLRSDVPAVMNAADGFVLSSESEGLPLVLLQASAAGLPIVATDVGGTAEAVVEGQNGYLVPSGDPEALALAMRRVSALPEEERAVLGRAGQARVKALFEMQSVAGRWERLYAEFLGGSEAGGPDAPPLIRDSSDVTMVPVP
jgi:glycosyltransferase involved in cell wall biosynthesis